MGIPKQDPEYQRAKHAFTRDLIQFHESRGSGLNCDPKINGKEVDLYLLYQIVTSHGGWEKINLRNEWDKLLEHFHLPRSTNGGIAIKQIYLRYLELYEKIHFLGEDIDAKEDHDDDYEDFRGRRRYPNSLSSRHSSHHSSTPHHGHGHHHHPKEITDHNRSQLGLSSRILQSSDYEGLLLSLQSPLPNEQDMAISVCTLLSNETKHVLHFSKSPAILNMLLAHAGIYQDCGMRVLMEETYRDARNLSHAEFWDEVLHNPDVRQLLCECYVKGVHSTLGLVDDEGAILFKLQEITEGNLPEEEKFALGTALRLKLARVRESRPHQNTSCLITPKKELSLSVAHSPRPVPVNDNEESSSLSTGQNTKDANYCNEGEAEVTTADNTVREDVKEIRVKPELPDEEYDDQSNKNTAENDSQKENIITCIETSAQIDDSKSVVNSELGVNKNEEDFKFPFCCSSCVCHRTSTVSPLNSDTTDDEAEDDSNMYNNDQFSIERRLKTILKTEVEERHSGPVTSLLFTKEAQEKVGQRIYQIAHILRNLSFEQDNALVMAQSPTLMRFLIIAANCSFGSLAQASFDIIGNIASHIQLEEPLQNPLSSMLLTLVTSSIFSEDRFKILRSLEALRELTKCDGNEGIIARYIESRVYERICDLLTLSDIMLLIYTLECILSMTVLGETVCDEIVRVQGSVATLVSLVTVEAQSYGPKGCIQMRVVETVTGAAQQHVPATSTQSIPTASNNNSSISSASATLSTLPSTPPPPLHQQQTIIHVPATQHLLQQQLQQPPNPIYASPQVVPTSQVIPSPQVTTPTPQVIPCRPSPANSPGVKIVSGTTTVVPPILHGQQSLIHQSQQIQQKPVVIAQNSTNGQVFTPPTAPPANVNNHINHPSLSSPTHHLSSQPQPIPVQAPAAVAVGQKPSDLPSANISQAVIETTTITTCNNSTPKNTKAKLKDKIMSKTNSISKEDPISPEIVKVNGVGPDVSLDRAEESSASSSILSSDGSDNVASCKSSLTSFHGVLHNGQASLDPKNELHLEGIEEPDTLKNRGRTKGMLKDLLERRVPPREPVNGVLTRREIRISEKGLELIDKMEESLGRPALLNHSSSTCTTNDAPESQKMTFYSSTSDAQVTLQGQASSTACVIPASVVGPVLSNSSSVTLASGVSGAPPASSNILKSGGLIAGQQVKLCRGNIVEVIEQAVGVPAEATVPAMETPAVIAEVEVESTDAPIAPAYTIGDGLATSATATNGGVTYVVSDSTQSSAVLVDVDSVIAATANSAPLVVDGNMVVVDGGEALVVEGGGDPVICNNNVVVDGDDIASFVRPIESNISNGGNNGGGGGGGGNNNGGGGDLLEKFSQFSDLIVVPPEQLASLKRPSSPIQPNEDNSGPNNDSSELPPPPKKQAMDSSLMEVTTENITTSLPSGTTKSAPPPNQPPVPVPVVSSAGSVSTTSPLPAIGNNGSTGSVVAPSAATNAVVSTAVVTKTTPSLPPGAGAQVVQLPLRLSVNPQNPQQLTFTRQLVLPSGQQVLLSTANSQSPLQGQVIFSKGQGAPSDPMPKAIIILQQIQQQQQQQQQPAANLQTGAQATSVPPPPTAAAIVKTTNVQQQTVAPPLMKSIVQQPVASSQQTATAQSPMNPSASVPPASTKPQIVAIQQNHPTQRLGVPGTTVVNGQVQTIQSSVQAPQQPALHQALQQKHSPLKQPQVMIQQQQHQISRLHQPHTSLQKPVNYIQFEGIKASSYPNLTAEQLDLEFPFMCEWAGCGLRFLRPHQVSMHALKAHCPETLVDAVRCEWGQNGCDSLLRKRFSLMTHLQDRHCSKQALEMALYRRKNRIDTPAIPQQPLHHPGYAPNAAFHAIKRHAMAFMSTKDHLHDDNEGPVTKSIRLTSALILRNLVNYSALGRRILRGYESHLSGIAMSNVESSRTIAQLLHDMNERPKSSK